MRVIVYRLLSTEGPEQIRDKIFPSGSLSEDTLPTRPFAVIRFGVTNPGMGRINTRSCQIWVHDEPGDYAQIDSILDGIYAILHGQEHVRETPGLAGSAELISSEWNSTSEDLYDPGFRTITKYSTYTLIGTGA